MTKQQDNDRWNEHVNAMRGHMDQLDELDRNAALDAAIVLLLQEVCQGAEDLHDAHDRLAAVSGHLKQHLNDMWREDICSRDGLNEKGER
jgi:hypothetical protein